MTEAEVMCTNNMLLIMLYVKEWRENIQGKFYKNIERLFIFSNPVFLHNSELFSLCFLLLEFIFKHFQRAEGEKHEDNSAAKKRLEDSRYLQIIMLVTFVSATGYRRS